MFDKICQKCKKHYQSDTMASYFCYQCKKKSDAIINLSKKKIKKHIGLNRKNRYLITQGKMINLGPIIKEKKEAIIQCNAVAINKLKERNKKFVVLYEGF